MRSLLFLFLAALFTGSNATAAKFDLDTAHTSVSFVAPHLVISKVKGRFDHFKGSFDFDDKTLKLDGINVVVKTESVNTNEKDRDKHLRSPDFFDTTKFPDMTFKSTKVEYNKNKPSKVHGDLTIRGISKSIILDVDYGGIVTDMMGKQVVAFAATGQVNRKDFGLNWNKTLDKGGVVVGDEIKIQIEGEAKAAMPLEEKKK